MGVHDERVRTPVEEALDGAREPIHGPAAATRSVRRQLVGERSLDVEHERHAGQATRDERDRCTLVEMRVHDVRPESPDLAQRRPEEEPVDVHLVNGGPGLELAVPRHPDRPRGPHTLHRPSERIGGDHDLDAPGLKRARFLIDPNVTAAVGEVRRRRDDEHAHAVRNGSLFGHLGEGSVGPRGNA